MENLNNFDQTPEENSLRAPEENSLRDAGYYYARYRQAVKVRSGRESPARKAVNRMCALVIAQIFLMLAMQSGIIFILSSFLGSFSPLSYYKTAQKLFSYDNAAGLLFISALYILCVFMPFAVYFALRSHKDALRNSHRIMSFQKISPLPFATAFFISLGVGVLAKWGNILIMTFLNAAGLPLPQLDFVRPAALSAQILFVLAVGVLPALIEEFNYRGVVLGELARFHHRGAVILSSLLFALMHCNVTQFFYAFAIGLSVSYFTLKFRSLWIAVAVHFAFNAYGTIIPLISGLNQADDNIAVNLAFLLLDFALIFLGSVFLSLFMIKYRTALPDEKSQTLRGKRFAAAVFSSPVFYIMLAAVGIITVLNAVK